MAASARKTNEGFEVTLDDGAVASASRLILATGVVDAVPDLPGLRERWGQSVFHCPYCHGYELGDGPIGVLAYDGDEVVGWAGVAPRAATSFARNRKIPHVDDLDVWSVWCIRVRPGHRGKGISHHLLRGAIDFARDSGAPALEGYPVDNGGEKVDLTMAYVGTRRLFEDEGFVKVADTTSVLDGFPRVLMRRDLR